MRRFGLPVLLLLIVLGAFIYWISGRSLRPSPSVHDNASAVFPMTVTDALGQKVTIPRQPERIVSLAPSVTETLFAIGAGKLLVADTSYCDYPEEAAKLPKIGGYIDPNVESIVALKPDMVLGAKGNPRDVLNQLRQLGIPVVTVSPESLRDVDTAIRMIGKVVGYQRESETLARENTARREAVTRVTDALSESERPRTLLLFSPDSLFSVGPNSYLDEMIRFAGGRNVAADAPIPWPELSMEKLITADPEIIILLSMEKSAHPGAVDTVLAKYRADRRWRGMAAVKNERVVVLADDELTLPGPRLINGLEAMAHAMHPRLFPDVEQK